MVFSRRRGRSLPSPAPLADGLQQEGKVAMSYGLSTRAFIEDGPAEQVAKAEAMRSTARSWRALDAARRLALVERALHPANDCIDSFPLAL